MTRMERKQREATEIVLAASCGDATDVQLERLSQLILEDDAIALFVVQLIGQEAWLTWHGSQVHAERLLAEVESLARRTASSALRSSMASELRQVLSNRESPPAATANLSRLASDCSPRGGKYTSVAWPRWCFALSAAVLICLGVVIGNGVTRWMADEKTAELTTVPLAYSARLVHGTACVWAPGVAASHTEGSNLRSGESLNLMEGLAEIELNLTTDGSATLQFEGPARMVLTAEGAPSLNLGKFSADVHQASGSFVFDTPLGQISVSEDSSLGIAVYGVEVEIHVFRGQVFATSPWTSDGSLGEPFAVEAGESLRLSAADDSAMHVTRGSAEPDRFTSLLSMGSDRLEITEEYVNEIVHAAPIVYWRFEDADNGVIRNEMGDRYRGVIVGSPSWSPQGKNRAIEFGSRLSDEALRSYIESSDKFANAISHSYSAEVWVKPSHYHLGALVSFVDNPTTNVGAGLHGMLLELGGPLTTPTTIEHPGRIRFLHRDPPSLDPLTGTSCFSRSPYDLRKWEHIVAVKDGAEMRLYINGNLVATEDDNSKLAPNLTLLVGQLDQHRLLRRFVGQLDELAIYDRALSDGEIQRHYRLSRSARTAARQAI